MSRSAYREEQWCSRHHVVDSKENFDRPKSRRAYFDHLPAVGVKEGELADTLVIVPNSSEDVALTEKFIHRRFVQFPQFRLPGKRPCRPRSAGWQQTGARRGPPTQLRPTQLPEAPGRPDVGQLFAALAQGDGRKESLPSAPGGSTEKSTLSSPPSWAGTVTSLDASPASPAESYPVASHVASWFTKKDASPASPAESYPAVSHAASWNSSSSNKKGAMLASMERYVMATDMELVDTDGSEEFPQFISWVKTKFQHIVCLWHRLDSDGSMMLHKGEFTQGMRRLQYPGHVERLWHLIDRDTTGTISFIEFAPESALELARFKRWADQRFGSARALFCALDEDHSGSVTFREFASSCVKLGLPECLRNTLRTLFLLFDQDHEQGSVGKGQISETELSTLDVWRPPAYLWVDPDMEARERFKQNLVSRYNHNPLLAWRKAMDKDGSMRVSYEEFVIQCKALVKKGIAEAVPACGISSLYVAFDQDRSGWFTLRDWDAESFECLSKFMAWCKKEHESVLKFFKAAEKLEPDTGAWAAVEEVGPHKGGVTFAQFTLAVKPLRMGYERRTFLFEALQGNWKRSEGKMGRLLAADCAWLATWNPEREANDDRLWSAMVRKWGDWEIPAHST